MMRKDRSIPDISLTTLEVDVIRILKQKRNCTLYDVLDILCDQIPNADAIRAVHRLLDKKILARVKINESQYYYLNKPYTPRVKRLTEFATL